jgi:hypothetical protein
MRRKPPVTASHDAHAARVAWWAAFLATVALVAILGLARSAQALTLPAASPVGPLAAAPSLDEEEAEAEAAIGEDEAEELEAEECEAEDVAEEEECEREGEAEAPQECLLTTADATIAASHDKVHLLVRYTTAAPTAVSVEYGLHGAKGSLYLGGEKKQVGARGKLRLSKRLSDVQMEKVLAAKSFTVRLRVPDAPAYCHPFFDRQLDVRRATPTGLAWSQSE